MSEHVRSDSVAACTSQQFLNRHQGRFCRHFLEARVRLFLFPRDILHCLVPPYIHLNRLKYSTRGNCSPSYDQQLGSPQHLYDRA